MKYFSRLLFIPVAIVVVAFAVANRQSATISLWPLPWELAVPVFLAVLGALAVGALIGGAVVWFSVVKWRMRAKSDERRIRTLEHEMDTHDATPANDTTSATGSTLPVAGGDRRIGRRTGS